MFNPFKIKTMEKIENYSRIEGAVNVKMLQKTHIIGIGAGGAYCLYDSLARSGIGKLTVLDFDTVDDVNIVRQGYQLNQIGQLKVDALGDHLKSVNGGLEYTGISKNFLEMDDNELDEIFGNCDLILLLTDSFAAQSFGNKLALRYNKPAIWAGFYEKSEAAEIVFTIPGVTPACFRCAVSPRYIAQQESVSGEIAVSSNCNTIFHSMLLDSYVGMFIMAILHNDVPGYEFSGWFGKRWDRNLLQIKVHPNYGTAEGSLFQRTFAQTEGRAFTFSAIFQKIEPERPPKYEKCPDCGGEALLSGTLHATYSPATYRTKDGASYYKYRFVEIGGGKFEIDILEQPSYRGRDSGARVVHRLPSARGGLKICVSEGCEPTSLDAAKNLAIGWAELTNTYIKTGVTIDEQVIRNAR